jgi:hypothetical protein
MAHLNLQDLVLGLPCKERYRLRTLTALHHFESAANAMAVPLNRQDLLEVQYIVLTVGAVFSFGRCMRRNI